MTYTVRPKADVQTGTCIDAQATIVFDNNLPIDTPAVLNTLDAGDPQSAVASLPPTSDVPIFTVSWSFGK